MNTKDFLRLGLPLGQAASRPPSFHFGVTGATDFIAKFIFGGANGLLDRRVKHVIFCP
jgi:hypothetical protein